MTRPTRATVEGRAFLDLRARANADGRPVDEYLTLYALEGFLERLSRSRHRDRFVLKGGVLLAAFDERRPTRDVDLAGLQLDNAIETVKEAIVEIAYIAIDDGLDIAAVDGPAMVQIEVGIEPGTDLKGVGLRRWRIATIRRAPRRFARRARATRGSGSPCRPRSRARG